jgi:hypothetical protein
MSEFLSDFAYILKDNAAKVMITAGVLMITLGTLVLNNFGNLASAASLFVGILSLVYGLFAYVGLFSGKLRSISGVGTLLICVSIGFVALGFVVIQFQTMTIVDFIKQFEHGMVMPYVKPVIKTDRPYVWLSDIALQLGLYFFIAGVVLKILGFLR